MAWGLGAAVGSGGRLLPEEADPWAEALINDKWQDLSGRKTTDWPLSTSEEPSLGFGGSVERGAGGLSEETACQACLWQPSLTNPRKGGH